jgi:hypothetical protein
MKRVNTFKGWLLESRTPVESRIGRALDQVRRLAELGLSEEISNSWDLVSTAIKIIYPHLTIKEETSGRVELDRAIRLSGGGDRWLRLKREPFGRYLWRKGRLGAGYSDLTWKMPEDLMKVSWQEDPTAAAEAILLEVVPLIDEWLD